MLLGRYLGGQSLHSLPVQPGQHVLDEERIRINLHLLQLCLLWVQWECRGIALAGLAGASKEVERKQLHLALVGPISSVDVKKRRCWSESENFGQICTSMRQANVRGFTWKMCSQAKYNKLYSSIKLLTTEPPVSYTHLTLPTKRIV